MVLGGDAGGLADDEARVDAERLPRPPRSMTSEEVGVTTTWSGAAAAVAAARGLLGSSRRRGIARRGPARRRPPARSAARPPASDVPDPHPILSRITAGAVRPSDRREGSLELAPARRRECRVRGEDVGQRRQPLLGALHQLGLELDEAIDDPRARDDIDLVEAQLDPRVAVAHDALAAQLADRDELEQGGVASQLEHKRPRIRSRPFERSGGPVGGSLELLAADRAARAFGARQRLDRDDRAATGLADADRETGTGQGAISGVHVAILELGRARRRGAGECPDLIGHQVALGGGQVDHAVLELDLDGRALVSVMPAGPASRPRHRAVAAPRRRSRWRGRPP